MGKNLISLFAGCGGLDLGLERSGFTTIFANELEEVYCESLRKNRQFCRLDKNEVRQFLDKSFEQKCYRSWDEEKISRERKRFGRVNEKPPFLEDAAIVPGDIRSLDSDFIRDIVGNRKVFLVAGGPPCQPFSKAGKKKSLDCTKNGDLFFEFVRVVKDFKPEWFLFENVKGITFTKTDVLYETCESCGYDGLAPFEVRQDLSNQRALHKCSNCESDNVRLWTKTEPGGSLKIIRNEFEQLGYKCFSKVLNAADFGVPQIRERLFIVGSRDGRNFEWPRATHKKPKQKTSQLSLYQDDEGLQDWVSMRAGLWPKKHPIFGPISMEKSKLWVKNVVRPHDEPVTWALDRPSPTIGAHQGAKLAFAPEDVPEKQLQRQQWATKGKRQGDTPPVPVLHAYLSDEELLKLQSFPRWWYLNGTRMQRAFQIGNAVPPRLAEVVGHAILNASK